MSCTVIDLVAVSHYYFVIFYHFAYTRIPFLKFDDNGIYLLQIFNGQLRYLTIWNLLIQGFFFTICLLNDIFGSNDVKPKHTPLIRRFKDMLLPCLAFPLSMFVGLTFWGIYFVNRELVFPKALDPYFPSWLNHAMHTNIMLFILVEMFTSFRQYPSRKFGIGAFTAFMLVYLVWIHIIFANTGMWVYPILDVLNLPLRIVFFVALLGLSIALYIAGEFINKTIWRKELVVSSKASKKRS